jgi:hypothetical protein
VFAGHDAVVNPTSAIPPMTRFMSAKAWSTNHRVRIQGSAAVVDAAHAAGVGRLVQESVSMLYRDQGACWVDEDAPIDRYPMARGSLAAETNAHRFSSRRDGGGVALTRSLRVSNARFRAATGWAPRYPGAREGWIAIATALNTAESLGDSHR